jgi:uncharacterized repeat protein (TIGR02543 family)
LVKKILSLVLALVMAAGLLPIMGTVAPQAVAATTFFVTVNDTHISPPIGLNSGEGYYEPGQYVFIYAGHRSGYFFAGWTIDAGGPLIPYDDLDGNTLDSPFFIFYMPNNPVTVTANWEVAAPHFVTINGSSLPPGIITPAPGGTNFSGEGYHMPGDTVYIRTGSSPPAGYVWNGWTVDAGGPLQANFGSFRHETLLTQFIMPNNPVTVTANWIIAPPPTPPAITSHPASAVRTAGESANFSVTVSGSAPMSRQWQVSTDDGVTWNDIHPAMNLGITGTNSNTITVLNATLAMNGHQFRAVATNTAGSDTSNPATLTVNPPPPCPDCGNYPCTPCGVCGKCLCECIPPVPEVFVHSTTPDSAKISLTFQGLTLPQAFNLQAFSTDGGKKWRRGVRPVAVGGIARMLNKGMTLYITDNFDRNTKKPAADAQTIEFPAIGARPKRNADKLKPFYGDSHWVLAKKGSTAAVFTGYEYAPSSDGRSADNGMWFPMPEDGFPIIEEKVNYLIRAAAYGTTPFGAQWRVRPAKFGKAPNYSIRQAKVSGSNDRVDVIIFKKGDQYAIGNGNFTAALTDKATIPVSQLSAQGTELRVRRAATGKRPPSETQTITLPAPA